MDDSGIDEVFYEVFLGLPRQGPGTRAATTRAYDMLEDLPRVPRLLDLGCGTGAQTLDLLAHTPCQVTACDNYAPFIAKLEQAAARAGFSDRLTARVADMADPGVAAGSLDIVWSEGAIYNLGFVEGLTQWRELLVPGGYVVVSEAAWLVPSPPEACRDWWQQEYPAITDVEQHLKKLAEAGYAAIGHFTLERSGWWDNYYVPLQAQLERLGRKYSGEPRVEEIFVPLQREIELYESYGESYGYNFYVGRRIG